MTEKEKKIIELFGVIRIEDTIKQICMAMVQSIDSTQESLTGESCDIPEKLYDEIFEVMELQDLMYLYAPVYAKYFSEEEIDQLIEIHKSPVYQKLLSHTADIINGTNEINNVWFGNRTEKLIEVVEKYNDEV